VNSGNITAFEVPVKVEHYQLFWFFQLTANT